MRFRGRNLLFIVVIASIFVPWDVKIIPQFMEFSALGWINTYLPLLVPLFFGYPFYIFIFRQFITQIPYSWTNPPLLTAAAGSTSSPGSFFPTSLRPSSPCSSTSSFGCGTTSWIRSST